MSCNPLHQSPMEQPGLEESLVAEASQAPTQSHSEEDANSPVVQRSNWRTPNNRRAQSGEDDGTGQLLSIVSGIFQQMVAQRCPHTLFVMSLLPLVKEVPVEKYFAMRMVVQQCIHSFCVPRQLSSNMAESTYDHVLSTHSPPPQKHQLLILRVLIMYPVFIK